ncbi:hypothetical protein BG003_001308 [Podila horticola]|nr:hypothetical protein BG003_001308 [Podila horticola]
MANSNKDSSRIHDAPHHQKHVYASVEEDEDDGWQVVSSSKDSQSVSSKTSSSSSTSSPSTEDDHPITTTTDIPSEASVATDAITPEFKEKPAKAKKKIFGTDEFQPVVSKKQIARANKLAGVRPNASVGISTSSYFDLLQDTEGTENVEEIVGRIREEEDEKARLLLEEQEQEQEQEKKAADVKAILEEEKAKKEAEIAQQALEQRQRQLEEEEEAKEQLLQQIAQQELDRAKEKEEKLAATAFEVEQKKQKEDKKQQQKKEKREKELKEKETAAAAVTAAELAQKKEEEEAQALAKDTHGDEDTTEEPTETSIVETVAIPEDDSWDVEEDDEWQQQSKSKKGRKTRGTQPGESSASAVSDLQSKMPIYLLEQDEIQQDSDEDEEVSEEEQQRRDEEKAKAAAKAKAKAVSNKKNKKKNNSNSNSAVSSPRMEGRKKNVSSNTSAVNSPRLEGKKSKKTSTTAPIAVTAEESSSSEVTSKLTNRGNSGSSTVEEESESQEKGVAEVQATGTEEGSTFMVSKDGSAGMVGGTLNSIFEKGVNPGLIKMLNLVFVALFLSLGFLIFASGGNLHVIALTGIAVALFVTIQWFLREMETMKIDDRKNV